MRSLKHILFEQRDSSVKRIGCSSVLLAAGLVAFVVGCAVKSEEEVVSRSENSSALAATEIQFETIACTSSWPTFQSGRDQSVFSIVESLGGGVALFDFDCDGAIDMFTPGGGTFREDDQPIGLPGQLIRCVNGSPSTKDATGQAGITACSFYTHGVAASDFDNDGFADFLVTGYGGISLWKNLGDGTFEDITEQSGLSDESWSTSAAWGDLDGDGDLDLYLCHYVNWSPMNNPACQGSRGRDVCSPLRFEGLSDAVYLSNGNGTFEDASTAAGLIEGGKGLAVTLVDTDRDSDLDVYVANDTTANFYYINGSSGQLVSSEEVQQRDTMFIESGLLAGVAVDDMARSTGSMGIVVLDTNSDQFADLFVTNYENELFGLYESDGGGAFSYRSRQLMLHELGQAFVGFGCVCADFDLDGDEDIAVANGHAIYFPTNSSYEQQPLILQQEEGEFRSVAAGPYFANKYVGRGVATGDLDANGLPDLVFVNTDAPLSVQRNVSAVRGTPLTVRLVGNLSTRDPIGSHVELTLEPSGEVLYRTVISGMSYLSTSMKDVHFGIPAGQKASSMTVTWPSGSEKIVEIENLPTVNGGLRVVIESE